MASDVKDLDVLVPEPRRVLLAGTEYTLPGDLPLEIFLTINAIGQQEDADRLDTPPEKPADDADEATKDKYDLDMAAFNSIKSERALARLERMVVTLASLFTWDDDEAGKDTSEVRTTIEHLLRRRGLRFVMGLVNAVYRSDESEVKTDESDAEGEPSAPKGADQAPASDTNGTTSSSGSPSPTSLTPQATAPSS